VYVITGVRGSGKTVFMTDISRTLAKDKRWVVVDLSVERGPLRRTRHAT
jgi:predicted AAA+ superfamily ATPase